MTYDVKKAEKNLAALRKRIVSNEKTARSNMQEFLVAAVVHGKETSDVSAVGVLLNQLGKRPSLNVSAARLCIEDLTSIQIVSRGTKASKEIKSMLRKDPETGEAQQITAAMVDAIKAVDWATYQRDVADTVYTIEDAHQRVAGVVSFLDKLLKGEAKGKTAHDSDVDKLRALRGKLIDANKDDSAVDEALENWANEGELTPALATA